MMYSGNHYPYPYYYETVPYTMNRYDNYSVHPFRQQGVQQLYPHGWQVPIPMGYYPAYYEQQDDYEQVETGKQATNPFVSYFQTEEGQYDFDKIFSTAGRFIGVVRQVTPVVSQISTFMKAMRP